MIDTIKTVGDSLFKILIQYAGKIVDHNFLTKLEKTAFNERKLFG
jgi:hypothetical protein